MLTRKILFLPHVCSGYLNRTFAFQITYYLRNRILGWYRYQHVYMIRQKMSFDHLALLLRSEISER